MKCVLCGGQLKRELVTFTYEDENHSLFIEHVPADVCVECGEKFYAPEITDALLACARHPQTPVRIRQIPVYEFQPIGLTPQQVTA